MSITRRKTREISIGNVSIGGTMPIAVQSMTNTSPHDAGKTLLQIKHLKEAGCEIIRCAVPDEAAVEPFAEITENSPLPVIADIHFRADLAVRAIEAGAAKVRINPGNIGGKDKLETVLSSASEHGIPVRIGVNAGSLEQNILEKYSHPSPDALAESMERYISFCEDASFTDLVLSIKASSLVHTVEANRLIAGKTDYPIHIGITEAGTPAYGALKSAVGLGALLLEGIGDTLRVSLSGDPVHEVPVARNILKAAGLRDFGPEIISCPTCGRTHMDVSGIAREVEEKTAFLRQNIRIAVMGCEVNGPGEAAEADIGIACGSSRATLFVRGKKIRQIDSADAVAELVEEIVNRFGRK